VESSMFEEARTDHPECAGLIWVGLRRLGHPVGSNALILTLL